MIFRNLLLYSLRTIIFGKMKINYKIIQFDKEEDLARFAETVNKLHTDWFPRG